MRIEHFFDERSATLSYVVHDGRSAVVIDPVRDYDPKSGRTSWAPAADLSHNPACIWADFSVSRR